MTKPHLMLRPALHAPPVAPVPDKDLDRRFMAAAIAYGRRNAGRAWPNPSVGCVLVRTDRGFPEVVGRGVTAAGGRPHAEVLALREAGEAARGATAYVTLEPCAHHGRTPPCVDALSAYGVARVVTGIEDPDHRVAGRGHAMLEAAGVQVTRGVLARDAARLHAGHIIRIREGRPMVTLKMAVSADGYIGRRGAGQVSISGAISRSFAHGLRSECDAIMVGVGTVLEDDPQLTCRLPGMESRSPVRVILDSGARTPVNSRLLATSRDVPTWIFTAPDAPAGRVSALSVAGARIVMAERDEEGRLDLRDVLFQLARDGVTSVLVEGGARVARALVEDDLVDEAIFVRSPAVIGEGGVEALAGLPLEAITASPTFVAVERRQLGDDALVHFWRRSIA
ncbi:MAG TPA: bifunctional diaminohydroxyphosphoribosylaminopyrimidine deaminase/5-amino-6-(5-phosphoribosylamino)uracil reductase RibD [Methylomirabilota bacterium]|nr:bifunctional diaminohydroxyphosphoribosylaminopyrimidine deaminase/5-amino-6-(5-phosphoribosylamino)uracil reductase RibD [Methylomirabilota bacterium]